MLAELIYVRSSTYVGHHGGRKQLHKEESVEGVERTIINDDSQKVLKSSFDNCTSSCDLDLLVFYLFLNKTILMPALMLQGTPLLTVALKILRTRLTTPGTSKLTKSVSATRSTCSTARQTGPEETRQDSKTKGRPPTR